jgi:alpha-tubulin suppressor-like RCC1 family protein
MATTAATAIGAGDYHTCVIVSNSGVECWGWNAYGQLGDGNTTSSSTPVAVEGVDGSGMLSGAVALAGGGVSHTP